MKHFIFFIVFMTTVFAFNQSHAEEHRSQAALHAFRVAHPCPGGINKGSRVKCRGYVIDHIRPLDCGGLDDPSNMQWQTIFEGHKKDRWERNGKSCHHQTHGTIPPGVVLNY